MSDKSKHIGLFGTFDLKNYGDLIFPDVFRAEIGKRMPEARVTLFSPVGGDKPFANDEPVHPLRDLSRIHEANPFDALVVGGGDLIRLDDAWVADPLRYPDASRPSAIWLVPLLFGRIHRIPVLFNAPGVPFRFSDVSRPFVHRLLSSIPCLNVRDEPSRSLLAEAAPDLAVDVVPDTVCLYGEHPDAIAANTAFDALAAQKEFPPRYALFQASGIEPGRTAADYAATLARLEDETGVPVLLFPIGYIHSDSNVLSAIGQAAGGRFASVRSELSPAEMFAVIGHAQWFLGTSMHGCLTAMEQGIPAVVLNPGGVTKLDGCMAIHGMSANVVRRLEDVDSEMLSRRVAPSALGAIRDRIRRHFDRLSDAIRNPPAVQAPEDETDLLSRFCSFVRDKPPSKLQGTAYFDTGVGFSERDALLLDVSREGAFDLIDATLPLPSGCRSVRIDPMEGVPLRVEDVLVRAESGISIPSSPVNGLATECAIVFPTPDPQFSVVPPDGCSRLSVRIRFTSASPADIWKAFEESLRFRGEAEQGRAEAERARGEAECARAEAERARAEAERARAEAERTARAANERLQAMQSSLSWRITKPLRRMLDGFQFVSSKMFSRFSARPGGGGRS